MKRSEKIIRWLLVLPIAFITLGSFSFFFPAIYGFLADFGLWVICGFLGDFDFFLWVGSSLVKFLTGKYFLLHFSDYLSILVSFFAAVVFGSTVAPSHKPHIAGILGILFVTCFGFDRISLIIFLSPNIGTMINAISGAGLAFLYVGRRSRRKKTQTGEGLRAGGYRRFLFPGGVLLFLIALFTSNYFLPSIEWRTIQQFEKRGESHLYDIGLIYVAAFKGDLDHVKLLIVKGANVNAKGKFGETPLQMAATAGHKAVAELLIAHGADVNAKDRQDYTPLHWAIRMGNQDLVELFVNEGAEINAKGVNEYTPLHWAASRDQKAAAELLIAKGANVNAKDRRGYTPLHHAARYGRKGKAMAELLVAKGAEVNAKDKRGETPLHMAAERGHKAVAELLITKGADVNVKSNKGSTPISLAAKKGNQEMVELLRRHGAKE